MNTDILIIGAGPAGLAFARALENSGLSVVIVERQPRAALADPAYDGREIALTHKSVETLRRLGVWDRIPAADIAPLREARVLNGHSHFALGFDVGRTGADALGMLVPNHRIRAALFADIEALPHVTLLADTPVASVATDRRSARAVLADGREITARLLVGADSRFSWVRDQLGIPAEMNRLGKGMLVARMRHETPHHGVATEWFDHHQTIAMLPLNGDCSSAVVTLPMEQAERLMALDEAAFGAEIARRYQHRLGAMTLEATRHLYPLVTTWSRHFAATRAALIGDAAVGMHPVTAHGFNLGLSGQQLLAEAVLAAAKRGGDIGGGPVLRAYESAHRRAAWPLYAGTNALVRLFTDERPPARVARHVALRLAQRMPMVRGRVRHSLMAR
ncbi:5-demethoxyubiquinol-8 5-hydroxylase UbiM [Sphingosinithalassobacter tenebrarum]|uniref:5-demethoxyubiquinol-8 5-hydroxylase UbiM n=2 Tax=Stakelama tenebrarum TaxID=2711215 RepID=A0A6G6YAW4_9SPHN|nr:5-demethoxyubiquinol-8 5-hydroxylase UbiM [Sphingosinithalassobacter tenebrarum]